MNRMEFGPSRFKSVNDCENVNAKVVIIFPEKLMLCSEEHKCGAYQK